MVMLNCILSFGALRLATPEDVLRLGVVCTEAFRYSDQFIWERPYHSNTLNILCFSFGMKSSR